ncbi:MAG: hypothetical protein IJ282_00390 [Lachnospiraceae bacterium]|nr:hypothetical protein [Lachnospiraceae bacterium]
MARGVKKSIEEKIAEKKELIASLEVRVEKERKELELLLNEQKQQEVESLYNLLKEAKLSVNEAAEILKSQACMA